MNSQSKWQPFIYALLIAGGLLIGILFRPSGDHHFSLLNGRNKLDEVLGVIKEAYVDTVDLEELQDQSIENLLVQLDPHSVYIPAKDLQRANEQLEGEFEGIGVEFSILRDTIVVVSAINGGPSKELGIRSGDRIIKVDGKGVAGIGITNEQVFSQLRGVKGSKVEVDLFRPEASRIIHYEITRDKIPLYSVDAKMMLNNETGYIKISRFGSTTYQEYMSALKELETHNFRNLIIDLRGNPGGFLDAVIQMVDEVLPDQQLILFTQGRKQPRKEYHASKPGIFEKGKLIVLIDEGSASASEIFAGAVQDHDRGLIIGRRSFGKGLVQEPFELSDGSGLRLTISRYYTPSGRCIQKPYVSRKDYGEEIQSRFHSGELSDSGKVAAHDSTPFKTAHGRIVYGGGGITPDIFTPLDTSVYIGYLNEVLANNLLNDFAIYYSELHRKELNAFSNATAFSKGFHNTMLFDFLSYAAKLGVTPKSGEAKRVANYIERHLKALIARQLFREDGYYRVLLEEDQVVRRALESFQYYDAVLKN